MKPLNKGENYILYVKESGQTLKYISASYQFIYLPTMDTLDIKNKTSRKDMDWLGSHKQSLKLLNQKSCSYEKIGSFGTLV